MQTIINRFLSSQIGNLFIIVLKHNNRNMAALCGNEK